tara:strand:- start:187 stop:1269 length:1083 start_codon:yes stop_codon:yes gene_type:complete
MLTKAKIVGAGSIGNHLAQACRRVEWEVSVIDTDNEALERMKNDIYPSRYEKWDEAIKLYHSNDEPKGNFDVIFVGTPPDSHLAIATKILKKEAPRVLQIEKPLCSPTLENLPKFLEEVEKHPDTMIVVGYDHILGGNTLEVERLIRENNLGNIKTLDADMRFHWGAILKAHPWLSGLSDTYLGHWRLGGGASGEHSHGLNLWQHLAHVLEMGRVKTVSGTFKYVREVEGEYDELCFLSLTTENGLTGRVAQDVVTFPEDKKAILQFEKGKIEWHLGVKPMLDQVHLVGVDKDKEEHIDIEKTRPDEFYREILHIQDLLDGKMKIENSPIRLERGLDTISVLKAAHESAKSGKSMTVEYL